jgi:hypothetical protein
MAEERPVEDTDEELLVRSCKRVLPALEGEVVGGVERVLASGEDRVLADGAKGDGTDILVGGGMMALGV